VRSPYVLTDGTFGLAGRVVASDERKGMLLYRVTGPLRQTARVEGLYPQDTWSGKRVTYTRTSCTGGSLTVTLTEDPGLYRRPQVVSAFVAGRLVGRAEVAGAATKQLTVPMLPLRGTCVVHFVMQRTLIPAVVTGGENPDPRALGIHFSSFSYSP
jgi:hypothetical protein